MGISEPDVSNTSASFVVLTMGNPRVSFAPFTVYGGHLAPASTSPTTRNAVLDEFGVVRGPTKLNWLIHHD